MQICNALAMLDKFAHKHRGQKTAPSSISKTSGHSCPINIWHNLEHQLPDKTELGPCFLQFCTPRWHHVKFYSETCHRKMRLKKKHV